MDIAIVFLHFLLIVVIVIIILYIIDRCNSSKNIERFSDLSPGTKFKYLNDNRVWVILENWGFGLVAPWKENMNLERPYKYNTYHALTFKVREIKRLKVIVVD